MKSFFVACCLFVACNAAPYETLSDVDVDRIADAIYVIEGGSKTKFPYGIRSIDTKGDVAKARKICINTIRNNHKRWLKTEKKSEFLSFLANRYAPIGAANDPKNLNSNWLKNLKTQLTQR